MRVRGKESITHSRSQLPTGPKGAHQKHRTQASNRVNSNGRNGSFRKKGRKEWDRVSRTETAASVPPVSELPFLLFILCRHHLSHKKSSEGSLCSVATSANSSLSVTEANIGARGNELPSANYLYSVSSFCLLWVGDVRVQKYSAHMRRWRCEMSRQDIAAISPVP